MPYCALKKDEIDLQYDEESLDFPKTDKTNS